MKFKELIINTICCLLIGLNAAQLKADTIAKTRYFSFGDYSCLYTTNGSKYLQFRDEKTGFFLRVEDKDKNNYAEKIRILEGEKDVTIRESALSLEKQLREVQALDIADRFLKDFSGVNPLERQEDYDNYLNLIRTRFLKEREPKKQVDYDLSKFFGVIPQNEVSSLEKLIDYTYNYYNPLVRELKQKHPDVTLGDLVNNMNFGNWIKYGLGLWRLSKDYEKNLDRLGYKLEGAIAIDGDYIQFTVFDKKKKEYLRVEINTASDFKIDLNEITAFLNGDAKTFFNKDYSYGAFRCEK